MPPTRSCRWTRLRPGHAPRIPGPAGQPGCATSWVPTLGGLNAERAAATARRAPASRLTGSARSSADLGAPRRRRSVQGHVWSGAIRQRPRSRRPTAELPGVHLDVGVPLRVRMLRAVSGSGARTSAAAPNQVTPLSHSNGPYAISSSRSCGAARSAACPVPRPSTRFRLPSVAPPGKSHRQVDDVHAPVGVSLSPTKVGPRAIISVACRSKSPAVCGAGRRDRGG
jgi:hypothetical protein